MRYLAHRNQSLRSKLGPINSKFQENKDCVCLVLHQCPASTQESKKSKDTSRKKGGKKIPVRLSWRFKEMETYKRSSLEVKESFSMLLRGESTLVEVPSYIRNCVQQKFSSKIILMFLFKIQ